MWFLQVENHNLQAITQQEDGPPVLEEKYPQQGDRRTALTLNGSGRESHWFRTGSRTMKTKCVELQKEAEKREANLYGHS